VPVCENCQTPYDEWQHFCLNCGQPLRAAPLVTRGCPQCGVQMALTQKYCSECGAPLQGEAPAPAMSRKWLWGGAALGLFCLGVTLGFFLGRPLPWSSPVAVSSGSPVAPAGQPETATRTGEHPPGEAPAAAVLPEVAALLDRIREANLTRNIALYMDTLSALYPRLDQKRQEVLKTWEKFAFDDMTYTVHKVQEGGQGMVAAEVQWRTLTRPRQSQEQRQDDFFYRIWFSKELGQWKIRQIEELQQ